MTLRLPLFSILFFEFSGGGGGGLAVRRWLRPPAVRGLTLALDEKARNQLKYNFIIFEQLSC